MERDMGTTLATKQDLEHHALATKQDLVLLRQEISGLRTELRQEISGLRTELRQEMENRFALQGQRIDTLELRLTVKLGSIMAAGIALTIAAMRLWT